jgi:hypothetical protein
MVTKVYSLHLSSERFSEDLLCPMWKCDLRRLRKARRHFAYDGSTHATMPQSAGRNLDRWTLPPLGTVGSVISTVPPLP